MKILKPIYSRVILAGFFLLVFATASHAQLTNVVGRFMRGTGTNGNYMCEVIPLSSQQGVALPLMSFSIVGTDYFPWNATGGTLYYYNATNPVNQASSITGRILANEPMVAFGARAGGSPLYFGQPYTFGIAAGFPNGYTNSLRIQVYQKSDFSLVNSYFISIPDPVSNTNEWPAFLANGYAKTIVTNGLSTTISLNNNTAVWGITYYSFYISHLADASASNYIFQVEFAGFTEKGPVALNNFPIAWWSRLYTIEFQARNPWRSGFVDQPQFAGQPMPPGYDGKTTDELLTNAPPVTNTVTLSPSACTNLDDSPELRRHPILDQFVSDSYLNDYNNSSAGGGYFTGAAGSLVNELAGISAPSTYVNGIAGFGNNVSTIYGDSGFLPAASYAISGWNVGQIASGADNINLVTGQPVGDAYQRWTAISSGVASTAGIAAGGVSLFNAATAPAATTPSIATPYGQAVQASTPEAQAALQQVQNGATVYRQGQFGIQNTTDAQFWGMDNPATTPSFSRQLGMPGGTAAGSPDWIMGGTLRPGAPAITRPAVPIGINPGGNIETVVNPGDISGLWFHMPD